MPQPAVGQVAGLSTTSSGTLLVFYESAGHSLTEMSYAQGRWSSPQSLGGVLTSGPTVWVRGTDGALWQNSGAGWFSLGGRLASDPAASPVAAGNYPILGSAVIAALGTDHAVWAYFETDRPAGGSGWQRVGGRSAVAPAVGPGGSPVYARGTDNALWLTSWDASATPPPTAAWHRADGALTSAPTATAYPSTAPYVVALGTDGSLWQGTPPTSGTLWTWTQIP